LHVSIGIRKNQQDGSVVGFS